MICYPLSIKFVTTPFKSWLNRFQLQLKFMTSISQHYPIFLKKWTLLKKLPCVFCWNYQSIMTLDRFNWITTRFKSWLFSPIWNSNWWLNLRQTLKKRTLLKIFRSLFCLQLPIDYSMKSIQFHHDYQSWDSISCSFNSNFDWNYETIPPFWKKNFVENIPFYIRLTITNRL